MNKIFTLFFIFPVAFGYSQNILSSLKACYPLDNNAQNNATTGSALNGTLINVIPTTGHTGIPNTAYLMNGTIGSYVVLPDNPNLKSDSVFFSGWFRVDSLPSMNSSPSLEYLVYTSNGCNYNFEAYSLHIYYEPSVSHYVFCVTKCGSNCGLKPQILSLVTPVAGNWYHICFYINNSIMKLYVNGAFQSSVNHNVTFGYQAGKKVYLGVTNESFFDHPFKGAIDNVRFYNRELTQQEITQLYTLDPPCDELPLSQPASVYSASKTQICKGGSIAFTDQSTNAPTAWNWQFPGGNPSSSALSNPTVTFPVAGIFTISLTASNTAGSGNISVQTITVSACDAITENNAAISRVRFYPNPAKERVYVENLSDNTLVIYDLLGKPVKYTKNHTSDVTDVVNLQDVVPGIYFVKINNTQGKCLGTIKMILTE